MHPYITQQLAAGRAADTRRRAEAARVAGRVSAVAKESAKANRSGSFVLSASRIRAWRAARRPITVPVPAAGRNVEACY